MARKKQRGRQEKNGAEKRSEDRAPHLRPETKKGIFAVASFLAAALFVLSYIGKGGVAGSALFRSFDFLLGKGYFLLPLAFVIIGFLLILSEPRRIVAPILGGGALFLAASLGGLSLAFEKNTGGLVGSVVATPLVALFDTWASAVILAALAVVAVLLTFNIPLLWRREALETAETAADEAPDAATDTLNAAIANINEKLKTVLGGANAAGTAQSAAASAETASVAEKIADAARSTKGAAGEDDATLPLRRAVRRFEYKKPPLELLNEDHGKPSSGDIKANSNIIQRTLKNFGIDVEMDEVSVGPTVTQYTLKPAEGVKLARITGLHNDLSLALAAHPIRIEAPIPGKSLVGIEVPNKSIALVRLRAPLEHKVFQENAAPLLFALGRDVTGNPVFADLAKMPHLLISGATGSGKSVSMNTIILSFLYRNPPELLRFIIVDPKRVELSLYNDIPHLLTPVITDAKSTIKALRWATKEMDRRYDLLASVGTKDITNYNAIVSKKQDAELLPYIVIVIDELADLMATFPREVEAAIVRLAQMARAVGIHLIVATQRPSVEVITGLIKANITSRIAFQVASQIDSRTILDTAGAEKLLGNGDMLFMSGDTAKPRRIQGAYVAEQEVKRVVDFLREEALPPDYDETILSGKVEEGAEVGDEFDGDEDPLYEEAKTVVVEAGKASASFLQRRLRVGYARAARLLDLMEMRGVIGPGEGAKPREILVGRDGDNAGADVQEI